MGRLAIVENSAFRLRVVRLCLLAIALAGVAAAISAFGWDPARPGGDAWNYLAAGERLNAGRPLYELGPGDRPVPLAPPYWTVPLLAPPPIAVAWRPLALLGNGSMTLWALATVSAVIVACLALRGSTLAWPSMALLAAPITVTALSGNFAGLGLAGLAAAWKWRDRPWILGVIIACLAAVKLTPALLLLWLAAARRWRAVAASAFAGAVILAVSIAGAGWDSWQAWFASVPGSTPSPLAIATLLAIPGWAVVAAWAAGIAVVGIVTKGDRRTFVAAVLGTALATPALYFQALALALAAIAPWVPGPGSSPRAATESTGKPA